MFNRLVDESTSARSDLTLKIKVLRFEHVFTDETHSHALIELDAMLLDTRNRTLLSSRLFRSEVKAETDNARGGALALNEALGGLLSKIVCWSAKESSAY